ncbi:hypothetical protein LTR37_009269 [Vermiconidia calcicola]|uniref:Uncharacterized protein n=1 Tax=Vermiconidia calcicola TaxID=1690605 RepID=A0ACC3N805_9PEZI|nr:hypothetical protein LTR37_009269 [Vermiconidia calcicola]
MTQTDDSSTSESVDKGELAALVIRTGSAHLVAQLLAAASPQWNVQVPSLKLQQPSSCLKHNASAIVDLTCNRPPSKEDLATFHVTHIRHIGKQPVWHSPPIEAIPSSGASTVIITGSGDAFHDVEPALDLIQRVKAKYIIHHMTRPLATGRLWDIIRNGPLVSSGPPDPDHLAVIIDADDLRAEGIALSRSLSWEATAEDFIRNLGSNGRLDTLVTCPNLIVRFGNEGIIHHRGRDAVDPRLYFPPREMEKPNNEMIGLGSAFTAGFSLAFPDCDTAIRLGMAATQRLSRQGFSTDPDDQCPNYPVNAIMDQISPEQGLSAVNVPSTRISAGDNFFIFDTLTGDPSEVARQIVTHGPDRALARCPVRKFGKLLSVDRFEQESLGSIVDTMHERLESGNVTPTCIGVHGPIGSGKKYVAASLSETVSERWPVGRLAYNARVMRLEDLTNVCNTIRDNAAENFLTVVSLENFEALLEPDNVLLDEFTAVMRYGTFRDGGHERSLGRCLLLFLVNQKAPRLESTPTPTKAEFQLGRAVDHSALLDNLHGVVNLSGPNQTGPQDKLFAVRRALMLRQLLKERHPHLDVNGKMKIDDAVLHALLFVPSFKHGLRSLEKIISTSRLSGRAKFDISALPPEEQIQLHCEGRTFMAFLRSPKLPPVLRERLAEGLFETYKKQRELMADTDEKKKALLSDRAMVDWDELSGELKESTRAQADDIPRKLRTVNCFMLNEERSDPLIHIPEFSSEDLDVLSEMEHERFNAERLQRQWRMGPRNSKQRTTPFLVPWRDLTQEWKDVDRVMVECVPRVLATAGYRIYRMKESD